MLSRFVAFFSKSFRNTLDLANSVKRDNVVLLKQYRVTQSENDSLRIQLSQHLMDEKISHQEKTRPQELNN